MSLDLNFLTESQAIKFLEDRGYSVRRKSETRRSITWSRTRPFPPCHAFQDESLLMIRRQLSKTDIEFSEYDGPIGTKIHTAILRLL